VANAIIRSTSSGLETSTSIDSAPAGIADFLRTRSPLAGSISASTTVAPSRANVFACSPMPEPAPVITAIFPPVAR